MCLLSARFSSCAPRVVCPPRAVHACKLPSGPVDLASSPLLAQSAKSVAVVDMGELAVNWLLTRALLSMLEMELLKTFVTREAAFPSTPWGRSHTQPNP